MDEIESIAFLLEQGYGFSQYAMLEAYKTDATNFFKNGEYVSGEWVGNDYRCPEGAVDHPYLVHWCESPDDHPNKHQEKAFATAKEAAVFFVEQRKERIL